MKRYIAEGIGTFGLVFCGTGAINSSDLFSVPAMEAIAATFTWRQ